MHPTLSLDSALPLDSNECRAKLSNHDARRVKLAAARLLRRHAARRSYRVDGKKRKLAKDPLMSATVAAFGEPFKIAVFADITCPWCYIGKRRLETVLAASPNVPFEIDWRAFQRDPALPADGVAWQSGIARGNGRTHVDATSRIEATLAEIIAAGHEVGLSFAFDKIAKVPNTFDAHRLIYWAYPSVTKSRIVERLFKAHFMDGLDIGDRNQLIALAQESGMDGDSAFDLFARRDDIDVLRREIEISRALVNQVPFFIFSDDVVVPGGRSEEELKHALAKAIAEAT